MKKKIKLVVIAVAIVCLLTGLAWVHPPTSYQPETWAHPVKVEGVSNLYRVTNELYRSDQPSALGMQNLKKLGIKTIVSLRSFHDDRNKISEIDLEYEQIHMKPWHGEEEDAVQFLRIVTDPKRTPVLVHCQRGADRTGAMIAVYRIAVLGWTKEEAIREMTEGGFGFHTTWENLPRWVRKLDIDTVKRKAGFKGSNEKAH